MTGAREAQNYAQHGESTEGTARAGIEIEGRTTQGRPRPEADHQVAAVLQTTPAPRRIRLRHHPDLRGPAAQAPLQRPGRHRRRGGHPAAGPGRTVPDRHRPNLAACDRLADLGGLRRRDDRDADRHPQPEGLPALRLAGRLHRGADPAAPPLPAGLPPSRSPGTPHRRVAAAAAAAAGRHREPCRGDHPAHLRHVRVGLPAVERRRAGDRQRRPVLPPGGRLQRVRGGVVGDRDSDVGGLRRCRPRIGSGPARGHPAYGGGHQLRGPAVSGNRCLPRGYRRGGGAGGSAPTDP